MTSGNFFLEKLSPSSLLDATQDKRRKHTQLPSQEPSKEHCLQKRGAVSFRVHSGRADTQRPAAQPSRTHSASSCVAGMQEQIQNEQVLGFSTAPMLSSWMEHEKVVGRGGR